MSADRTFVDTNVFAYLFDESAPKKQSLAASLHRDGRCQVAAQHLAGFDLAVATAHVAA
jgi:predicted nucleic acid-binding protein